jgi:hypothetical protein
MTDDTKHDQSIWSKRATMSHQLGVDAHTHTDNPSQRKYRHTDNIV